MEILFTSIIAFISTNIDDLFILTLFFGNSRIRPSQIIGGEFLGIIALIVVSMPASLIGLVIDPSYIGVLGLVPIYLGLKGIWQLIGPKEEDETSGQVKTDRNKVLAVAGVTFANGGDNIGIYAPLFGTLGWTGKLLGNGLFDLHGSLVWAGNVFYKTPDSRFSRR